MNKEQFVKGMKYLCVAYNKEFDKNQITVWYDFFKDTSYDNFRNAIKRIIPKNQFMPSIAEVKQEIALMTNPVLQMNVDEEWEKVIKAIRSYGSYRQIEALESLEPYTRNIVKTIGWQRLCMSENIEWERKTFKELFNNKQENYEEALLLSEPTMTLSELKRTAEIKTNERLLLEQN